MTRSMDCPLLTASTAAGLPGRTRSWSFSPLNTLFAATADPCPASLLLTAVQPLALRGAEVQVRARPEAFATVQCPTADGFVDFSEEAFTAEATGGGGVGRAMWLGRQVQKGITTRRAPSLSPSSSAPV